MILIALNKPAGIVCTAEKREKNNVIDYLNYPKPATDTKKSILSQ